MTLLWIVSLVWVYVAAGALWMLWRCNEIEIAEGGGQIALLGWPILCWRSWRRRRAIRLLARIPDLATRMQTAYDLLGRAGYDVALELETGGRRS